MSPIKFPTKRIFPNFDMLKIKILTEFGIQRHFGPSKSYDFHYSTRMHSANYTVFQKNM